MYELEALNMNPNPDQLLFEMIHAVGTVNCMSDVSSPSFSKTLQL